MAKFLIIYSSTDGHIKEKIVENRKYEVTLIPIDKASTIDLNLFDKIIIGASIRYGKHSKIVYQFVEENWQILDSKSNAFFLSMWLLVNQRKILLKQILISKSFSDKLSGRPKNYRYSPIKSNIQNTNFGTA